MERISLAVAPLVASRRPLALTKIFIRRVRARSTADFAQTDPSFAVRRVNPPQAGPSSFPSESEPQPPRRSKRRHSAVVTVRCQGVTLQAVILGA